MKRLVIAALLAMAIHILLFSLKPSWRRPSPLPYESRSLSIDLKTFLIKKEKPANPEAAVQTAQPKSKVPPPPAPKPRPSPPPKPRPQPAAEPQQPARLQPPSAPPAPPVQQTALKKTSAMDAIKTDDPIKAEAAEPSGPNEGAGQTSGGMNDTPIGAIEYSVPLYEINPPPVYPRAARRRNIEGTVMLDVRVTESGRVAEIKIARSSGHAVLDRSAVKAVTLWRFKPAIRSGRAMETWVTVPVRFKLE